MSFLKEISPEHLIGALNGGLRLLSMASRFVLLLILLKNASPDVVGTYGLLSASVAFLSLIVGADFYQYAQRELITLPQSHRSFVLQHQAIVIAGLYAVLLPLSYLAFVLGFLPYDLLLPFLGLSIVEHLGQELGRALTSMAKPLVAGWVLFLRTAAWVWLLAVQGEHSITLNEIIMAWTAGSLSGLALAAFFVYNLTKPWKRWPLDTAWIQAGLKQALLYFSATVALKGITTADRYMMQHTSSAEVVGAYVAYIGIAMTLINLLDASVFSQLYPKLVRHKSAGDDHAYQQAYRSLRNQTWVMSILASLLCAIAAPYIFKWAHKPVYIDHLDIFYVIVIAVFFYAVSMVPHYGLYAERKDVPIVATQVIAILPFSIVFGISKTSTPDISTALALTAAFIFTFIAKELLYRQGK